MAENRQAPAGGGIFIVLGIVAGVAVGRLYGQTSMGLVGGIAIGAAIATSMWWRSRGR
jgi:uncharacterized membrane protein